MRDPTYTPKLDLTNGLTECGMSLRQNDLCEIFCLLRSWWQLTKILPPPRGLIWVFCKFHTPPLTRRPMPPHFQQWSEARSSSLALGHSVIAGARWYLSNPSTACLTTIFGKWVSLFSCSVCVLEWNVVKRWEGGEFQSPGDKTCASWD